MERAGEAELDDEVEHLFEEGDLSLAVVAFVVVVEADFADTY